MKNAKLSVQVWGIYLLMNGIGLFVIPNLILTTLGFAATSEPWVRIVGALATILGYFFLRLSGANVAVFYPWTVHARFGFASALTALVILNLAPVNLMLFAVVDFLGGLWTFLALRSQAAMRPAANQT
jgi:hypothetical protein